ncbi:MAG: helix-turn-helix domain-containing protein [Prevotella sp.]|nr:helix-turn-helix domain-containing protein [Prevotella sp.]
MMLYNLLTSLPMMVCAFFTVLILLGWNDSRLREQRTLFGYMLSATLLYAGHYVFFNHVTNLLPLMDTIYVTTNLAVYPLYLIYIIRLTSPWKSSYGWLLLPAIIGGVATCIGFLLLSPQDCQQFVEHYLYHNQTAGLTGTALWLAWTHIICKVVFAIEVIVTVVVGYRLIRNYHRQVNELYADTDDKSMRTIQTILLLVLIASTLSFVANIIGRYRFTDSFWLLLFPSAAFSALLFSIGHAGLQRRFSFKDLGHDRNALLEEMEKPVDTLSDLPLTERIITIVEREKIFLQPNLKLDDLARLMNTNRTYIYQAINQQMGVSFNELINRRRIRHAQLLMTEKPELSVNEVATQSGFSSLSSFYRNLKKYKEQAIQ